MTWVSNAAIATYVISAVTAASSVYQGEQSRKASSKGERAQREAQRVSLLSTTSAEKVAAQAEAKANRKKPDVNSLLFAERARADMGAGSTILAGRGGGTPLMGTKSKSLMGS